MKASKFTNAQKAFILKQGEEGTPVAEICRKAGIRSIANNMDNLTDYGRRYRRGLPISSSRAEGCVDDIGDTRMG